MTNDDSVNEEFGQLYARHVAGVAAGDNKAVLADMVQANLPTVLRRRRSTGAIDSYEIVGIRADGDRMVGETIYRTASGVIGLRSIWERHGDSWLAAELANFLSPKELRHDRRSALGSDGRRSRPAVLGRARRRRTPAPALRGLPQLIWGPQSVCAQCHGFDIDWESVEAAGTIYSWSRSWYPTSASSVAICRTSVCWWNFRMPAAAGCWACSSMIRSARRRSGIGLSARYAPGLVNHGRCCAGPGKKWPHDPRNQGRERRRRRCRKTLPPWTISRQ